MNDIATTIAAVADANKRARKKISVPYEFPRTLNTVTVDP
jgi:hypothetical protein